MTSIKNLFIGTTKHTYESKVKHNGLDGQGKYIMLSESPYDALILGLLEKRTLGSLIENTYRDQKKYMDMCKSMALAVKVSRLETKIFPVTIGQQVKQQLIDMGNEQAIKDNGMTFVWYLLPISIIPKKLISPEKEFQGDWNMKLVTDLGEVITKELLTYDPTR